jgi:hypothetical protein
VSSQRILSLLVFHNPKKFCMPSTLRQSPVYSLHSHQLPVHFLKLPNRSVMHVLLYTCLIVFCMLISFANHLFILSTINHQFIFLNSLTVLLYTCLIGVYEYQLPPEPLYHPGKFGKLNWVWNRSYLKYCKSNNSNFISESVSYIAKTLKKHKIAFGKTQLHIRTE